MFDWVWASFEFVFVPFLLSHFIGDFKLQPDEMAKNKSEKWSVLLKHVVIYSLVFCWSLAYSWWFMLITGICHFAVDAVTCRLTKHFWEKEDRHNFFVTIGADQMIHYILLFVMWEICVG